MMSTMMQSPVPRLDFGDLLHNAPAAAAGAAPASVMSPLDFDFGPLDEDELKDFGDLTDDLLATSFEPSFTPGTTSSIGVGGLVSGNHTPTVAASPAPAPFPIYSAGAGPKATAVAAAAAAAAAAAVTATAPAAAAAGGRVAGTDTTNRQRARAPRAPKRKKVVKAAAATAAPKSTAAMAPPTKRGTGAGKKKAAGGGRKRSKMPEAEQKRRNCESAKRSRLKKMRELAEARAKAERLEAEVAAYRKKFEEIRELGYSMALHLASHHKGCECEQHAKNLERALLSPSGFR